MLTLNFICTLPNGIHARPASEIEQRTQPFSASITLINLSKKTQADAKSVLGMIGADITNGDSCQFLIEGGDQQAAFEVLQAFMRDEFADCDEPLAFSLDTHSQPLPVFIEHAGADYVRGNGVSMESGAVCRCILIASISMNCRAMNLPLTSYISISNCLMPGF